MKKSFVSAVLITSAVASAVVHAQGAGGVAPLPAAQLEQRLVRKIEQAPTGEMRVVTGSVESKITTGRPYSAEAVTESVQVLADGNRIGRTSMTRVYRDGEGRTRREMFGSGTTATTVSISDPVAHVSYTLDTSKRIAYRTEGNVAMPAMGAGARGGFAATAQPRTVPPEGYAQGSGGGRGGGTGTGGGAGVGVGGGGGTMMRTPAPDDPNVKKEDLGVQNIEGVLATGTRTTTTIPAGDIGNAQPIKIVSEQWFSDDLQVLVMTKHSDPRAGETIYRLRNILRAEPDQALFTAPPDYTVVQRGVRQQ